MNIADFLSQVEFVKTDNADADVVVVINGHEIDVEYVERDVGGNGPFRIVPKHRRD